MQPDLKIVAGPQSGVKEVALEGQVAVEPGGGIEGTGGALGAMSTLRAEHTATESSFGHFRFFAIVPC